MKKLLSIAATTALLSTGAMAYNIIDIIGEILPSAVVGFADVSGETLTGSDKFLDASIDLGAHEVDTFNDDALAASTQSIFVKTNVAKEHSVTMAIKSDKGDNLETSNGDKLPVKYKIGDTELKSDGSNSATLVTEANKGSTAIDNKFTITPDAAADQVAGKYAAQLTVTIVAN